MTKAAKNAAKREFRRQIPLCATSRIDLINMAHLLECGHARHSVQTSVRRSIDGNT